MVEPAAGQRTSERPPGSELVVSLSELSTRFSDLRRAVAACGGKAANLAQVAALGLSVPPGFVVTCSAWRRRVAHSVGDHNVQSGTRCNGTGDFGSEVGGVEARDNGANASPEKTLEQFRERVPDEVRDEIANQLAALPGSGPVVVRSSAVGEDSAHAAFAGLLTSELDVPAELDAVLAALSRCWASYSAPRVAAYRAARGVALSGMAVLVQRQVNAAWAGVLFTRSPMSGGRSQPRDTPTRVMLVEYCEGFGEKLVSGAVSPGRLAIECKAGGEPYWRLNAPWRGEVRSESTSDARAGDLPERVIPQLFEAATRIEAHFNAPQDIEWASDSEDRLFIVQSRPITAIAKHRETGSQEDASRLDDDESAELWSNVNVNENYPEPITPVLFSIAELGYYHYFRGLGEQLGVGRRRIATVESSLRRIVGLHGARLYYNLTSIHAVIGAAPLGDWLADAFDQFVGVHDEATGDERSMRSTASPPPSRASSRILRRLRDGWEIARIGWNAWRTIGRLKSHIARFERRVTEFADAAQPKSLASLSLAQLNDLIAEFIAIRSHGWIDAAVGDAASMTTYSLLKQVLRREFPDADQAALHNSLLKGQRDLVSTRPARELARIAKAVRENSTWSNWLATTEGPQAFEQLRSNPELATLARSFEQWLADWGFRNSGELLLTRPSFQECPEEALELLRSYVANEFDSELQLSRHEIERRDETKRVLEELRTRRFSFTVPLVGWRMKVPWLAKSAVVERLLSATQRSIACRERARLKQALLYTRLRRVLLELGGRLTASQHFAVRDDVFFLTIHELHTLAATLSSAPTDASHSAAPDRTALAASQTPAAIRSLVLRRKSEHEQAASLTLPSRFRLRRGDSPESLAHTHDRPTAPTAGAANELTGVSVCGGRAIGRAVVLLDVTEAGRLAAGSILVTRQTDPGWAPVFPLIRGLVLERGGMLSHGAILAREYGLPSLVAVQNATSLVPIGKSITVDGDRGTVSWSEES